MKILSSEPGLRLSLAPESVLDLEPRREGTAIDVREGCVWITQAGDDQDHVLSPGESFRTAAGGKIVVQALESSVVAIASSARCARWSVGA